MDGSTASLVTIPIMTTLVLALIVNSNPTAPAPSRPGARSSTPAPSTGSTSTMTVTRADVAFTFTFSEYDNGRQTATAWYATDAAARSPGPAGEVLAEAVPVSFDGMAPPVQAGPVRLLAGRRSGPFFADVEGTLMVDNNLH